jgi:hypothetical protein
MHNPYYSSRRLLKSFALIVNNFGAIEYMRPCSPPTTLQVFGVGKYVCLSFIQNRIRIFVPGFELETHVSVSAVVAKPIGLIDHPRVSSKDKSVPETAQSNGTKKHSLVVYRHEVLAWICPDLRGPQTVRSQICIVNSPLKLMIKRKMLEGCNAANPMGPAG